MPAVIGIGQRKVPRASISNPSWLLLHTKGRSFHSGPLCVYDLPGRASESECSLSDFGLMDNCHHRFNLTFQDVACLSSKGFPHQDHELT